MLERHAARAIIDPIVMAEDLIGRLGSRRANAPRLADLLHVTPPRPDPVVYARMVLDAGVRREIAGTGILLRAAAVQTATDRVALPVTATCNVVDAILDSAASPVGTRDRATARRRSGASRICVRRCATPKPAWAPTNT